MPNIFSCRIVASLYSGTVCIWNYKSQVRIYLFLVLNYAVYGVIGAKMKRTCLWQTLQSFSIKIAANTTYDWNDATLFIFAGNGKIYPCHRVTRYQINSAFLCFHFWLLSCLYIYRHVSFLYSTSSWLGELCMFLQWGRRSL